MKLPTYYTLLDMTQGLAARATSMFSKSDEGKPARVLSLRKRMLREANDAYDNLVGRFDTPNKVPSRELVAPGTEIEEKALLKLGAVKREDGQWIVPDELDLDKFEEWWPMVPEDLRDETPRMLLTRDGRRIETRLLLEDVVRGDDSTATALLYGGFAAVAITCYVLFHLHWSLGLLGLLSFIPFTWAMSNAEGPREAFKCLVALGFVPLTLSMGLSEVRAGIGVLMTLGPLFWVGGLFAVPLLGLIVAFFATVMDDNKESSIVGGTFGKFKVIMMWATVYNCALAFMVLLGAFKATSFAVPVVPFLVAAMYPLVYFNGNFMKRYKTMRAVGDTFGYNLGTQGALAQAHVMPKMRQAERALRDTSAKFVLGKATGVLTAKQLPDAPDAGKPMILTDNDLSRHLFYFGATGSGKTESGAKQVAVQWVTHGCGGMLVLDGKGALPGDIRELIDVMIAPGVNFAPFEGLDGHAIALAVNAVASAGEKDGKHSIWVNGASHFCTRAFRIFDALHNHEKRYKQHAADMAARKELEIDALNVELAKMELLKEDTAEVLARLQGAQKSYNQWASARDAARKWKWTVDTAIKVINMINTVERDPATGNEIPGKLFREAIRWLGWGVDPVERARNPQLYHPEIGTNGLLDGAIEYVINDWVGALEPQQRSSFHLNVMERILPLATDPYMVGSEGAHWKTLEHGVDARVCLRGQSVGVFLPKEKHGQAGHLISALIKQGVYDSVALRGGDNPDWREKGETPVLLLVDECQDLVDEAERDLLPKARSLGLRAVFMTQELESLINKFGNEHKARQFVDTFQSFIKLTTRSRYTQEYVDARLGVAPLVKFQMPTRGLDFEGGVKMVAESTLNDVNHPGRAVLRKVEKEGGVKFLHRSPTGSARTWGGSRLVNPEDTDVARGFQAPAGGKLEEGPLLTPAEHRALITTGRAVVYLMRAGEPRIDVADVSMVSDEQMQAAIAAKRKREKERLEMAQASKREKLAA